MAIPAGEYAGHMSKRLSHPLASMVSAGEYGFRWRVWFPLASMAIPAGEYARHVSKQLSHPLATRLGIPAGEIRWRDGETPSPSPSPSDRASQRHFNNNSHQPAPVCTRDARLRPIDLEVS
ncbi:uncharacterized protein J3D65DRAFT_666732 [Phyllosticta citribraziliensis]|uniref:Uncharacterized protein n=1 Tax=Phyllosticta citribraziliensis TaxID=989973 RepID=A0ABR1LZY4_9PEZI